MARKIGNLVDVDDLVQRYLSGDSLHRLSARYGVSRYALEARLKARGVAIRGLSEGQWSRYARTTAEERRVLSQPAHDAMRGRKFPGKGRGRMVSYETRIKTALTVQARQLSVTPTEMQLASMLVKHGLNVIPQQAVGIYNCDLGTYPVAVEIFGGGWHFSGRHLARASERLRYFLDAGWHVIMVWVTSRHPLSPEAADYIAAFYQQARRNPAAVRQYRMIRGAAEVVASGSADDDHLAVVPALRNGRNALGRYATIPV